MNVATQAFLASTLDQPYIIDGKLKRAEELTRDETARVCVELHNRPPPTDEEWASWLHWVAAVRGYFN